MIDDIARAHLLDDLRWVRRSLLSRVDGLSEYDVRRPLTRTGTNLLGLVKHLTITEARYLGEVFGRPYPEPLPRWGEPGHANRDDLWVTEHETRADVLARYERACRHADETVESLPVDTPARVPWWPQPEVTLFHVMVHVLTETNRHAGHADILREQVDGATGADVSGAPAVRDEADWSAHRDRVERAARAVGLGTE